MHGLKKQTNQKQDSTICCLQETGLRFKDAHELEVNSMEKTVRAREHRKSAGAAMSASDKTDLRPKAGRRDKEGH